MSVVHKGNAASTETVGCVSRQCGDDVLCCSRQYSPIANIHFLSVELSLSRQIHNLGTIHNRVHITASDKTHTTTSVLSTYKEMYSDTNIILLL